MRQGLIIRAAVAFATSVCLATPALSQAVIIDTGAPTNQIGPNGPAVETSQWLAAEFSLSGPGTIQSIESWFNAWTFTDGPATMQINIIGNEGFVPNNVVYYSSTFTSDAANSWEGLYGLDWNLAGGSYWVTFAGTSSSSVIIQTPSAQPVANEAYSVNGDWRYGHFGLTLRVLGELGEGVVVDTTTPLLPEPSSWAMMLLGFGAIGYSMRRKRLFIAVP